MALVLLGGLAERVMGTIGGSTWRSVGGRTIVSVRRRPMRTMSAGRQTTRVFVARAARAWVALSASARADWETAAARCVRFDRLGNKHAMTGLRLYVAAVVIYAGTTITVTPVVPGGAGKAAPVVVSGGDNADDLVLRSLGRDLTVNETAIVRVYGETRSTARRGNRRLVRVVTVPGLTDPGPVDDYAGDWPGTEAYASYTGSLNTGTSTTVELWHRNVAGMPARTCVLWNAYAPLRELAWNPTVGYRIYEAASVWNVWNPVMGTAWHYAVVVYDDSTHTATFYWDGVARWSLGGMTGTGLINNWRIGDTQYLNYWYKGQMDELRVSNVQRSAAEILASYNQGVARRLRVDAGTVAKWDFNGLVGGKFLDQSSHGRDLTNTGVVQGRGLFNRVLYLAAESGIGAERNVEVQGQVASTVDGNPAPVRVVLAWP